jgi:histidyl-tRNA synthetase
MIRVVEGATDLLPQQMLIQKWLSQKIEGVLALYGFEPWDSPLLEYRSLYKEHSNEDLVNLQAFTFNDLEGTEVVLRSELTPSLARVIAMHQDKLSLPLRWYSNGPFWRNENLVPGRGREFRQWNIDTVGIPEPFADIELILQAIQHLQNFGFKDSDVVIRMNNRALLAQKLRLAGIPQEKFNHIIRLLDRSTKSNQFNLFQELEQCSCSFKQLSALEDYLQDTQLWKEDELLTLIFQSAEKVGLQSFLQYEPKMVRFPLYYTGLVFEAFDRHGCYPAILGGGRYDMLIQKVGGSSLPAAGFAIGNITLVELLRERNLLPQLAKETPALLVCARNAYQFPHAVQLAQEFRSLGQNVEIAPQFGNQDQHLAYAKQRQIQMIAFVNVDCQAHKTIEILNVHNQNRRIFNSALEAIPSFSVEKIMTAKQRKLKKEVVGARRQKGSLPVQSEI